MLNVNWNPLSVAKLIAIFNLLKGYLKCFLWILFSAQSWVLWTTRNKFTMEAKYPEQPANYFSKIMLTLQQWRSHLKPKVPPLLDARQAT
jgi:hypothetical protein